MDNVREWWSTHRPATRRLAQLYCALLYNANLKGFVEGEIFKGNTKAMCVPGFNCYSCPGAVGACPLGSLQNALASSGTHAGSYMLGIILLFGLILGRTVCGWLCPLGLFQELLHKIPTPKILKNRVTRVLSYLKYVVLAVFVIAIPMWYGIKYDLPIPGFCKYICPAGTFEGAMGLLGNPANSDMFSMLGILFTRKAVILVILVFLCIFCYRAFCRFLCPLGAIYSLFNRFAIIGVKVNPSKCTHCGNCVRSCQMDVRHVGDHECISCGECMNVCAAGAISLKAGRFTLKAPEVSQKAADTDPALQQLQKKHRSHVRIAWLAALALLAAALFYYNGYLPGQKKGSSDSASVVPSVSQTDDPSTQDGDDKGPGDGSTTANGAGMRSETESEEPISDTEPVREEADTESTSQEADTESVNQETDTEPAGQESSAPVGSAEGEQLKDFEIELHGGGSFHLKDMRGKIVIINRWATWCPPCVQEIPFFCQISEENPDVYVLLVHANPVLGSLDEYLETKEWGLDVAIDSSDLICDIVKGSSTLPQTTVLNARGEIIYNQTGSVNYEKLNSLIEKARL